MRGTVGAPAPLVLWVEAPADVQRGAGGEVSRRCSIGNTVHYSVVRLPILHFLCVAVPGGRGRGRGRGEGGPPVRGTVGAPAPLVR